MPYYLDGGRVYVLWVVEWGIYLNISIGTTMSMMLLFTQSSKIRRTNVGSHAISVARRTIIIVFVPEFWPLYDQYYHNVQ